MTPARQPTRAADSEMWEGSKHRTRWVTERMAMKLVTLALQVARGPVDHNVVEAARRIADEINERRLVNRRAQHAAMMRKVRASSRRGEGAA